MSGRSAKWWIVPSAGITRDRPVETCVLCNRVDALASTPCAPAPSSSTEEATTESTSHVTAPRSSAEEVLYHVMFSSAWRSAEEAKRSCSISIISSCVQPSSPSAAAACARGRPSYHFVHSSSRSVNVLSETTLPSAFVMLAATGLAEARTTHGLELKAPGQSFSPHVEHFAGQMAT